MLCTTPPKVIAISNYICAISEHDGPVTAVDISSDGMKILAGTCTVCEEHDCNVRVLYCA